MSREEKERRADVLVDERSVPPSQHELDVAEETRGADDVGVLDAPARVEHPARTLTAIIATASPKQQYVGRDVTITGRLTSNAVGLPNLPITLYCQQAGLWTHIGATATNPSGGFAFEIQQSAAGKNSFAVAYPGDATFEPSLSPELPVTFVTIPTTITATASPGQQYVGQDVAITGRLTTDGAPLANAPITLYNADDVIKRVPVAVTTTNAAGYYQFTLTDTVVTTRVYVVCVEGDSKYGSAQSTELLVAYTAVPAEVSAVKARLALNLAWYEILPLLLIFAGESLLFAGYQVLGVSVESLNIVAIALIVVALHGERVQLLTALALLSVFRIANLSFALISTVTIYWLAAIYGLMYLPLISVIIQEKLSRYDLGIDNVRRSVALLPLGAAVGIGFAFIEYAILGNKALIPTASVSELVQLSIVMIFFVALVEELLFRVLLQPRLIERSGAIAGILITSVIFGVMHAGYANIYELLFATGAGVVLGVAFYKTRNLPLVVTIQAVNNIVLFGVLPFLPLVPVLSLRI